MKIKDVKAGELEGIGVKETLINCGFQATNIGKAIGIIERMKKEKATVFLTFTSNMVASGMWMSSSQQAEAWTTTS